MILHIRENIQTASSPLSRGQIQENIPDTGEHFRYRRTFQIQENIPDTGEHFRYRRTFQIQENIPDTGEHS